MFVEIHGTVQGCQMGQSTLTGEPKRAKGLHRAFVPTEVENSSSVGLPGEGRAMLSILCCILIHLISFTAKRFKEQTCLKSVCFCNSYLEHRLTAIYYPGH